MVCVKNRRWSALWLDGNLLNGIVDECKDVLNELNLMNFGLFQPLSPLKAAGLKIDLQGEGLYKTHIKKPFQPPRESASYIFVLSIILPL